MGNPAAIRDKVAIIGMGCTKFGENFQWSSDDMIIDATFEATEDAGVDLKDIEAGFIAVTTSGATGCMMAIPLKMGPIPITRVENGCSSGIDAIRCGAMSIACGLYDLVLCVGVEKLKDSGYSGLPEYFFDPVYGQGATAPGRWAMGATRYFSHYGLSPDEGKRALAQIAVKNHANGVKSPKAHFRRAITLEQALNAPIIAWPLGLFDCCAVTDGAAACILCPADKAKSFRDDYNLIKGIGLAMGPGRGKEDVRFQFDYLPETTEAARLAYEQAGITNPREEISLAQCHDCFTIAELLEYEALQFSPLGKAKDDIEAGSFTLEGDIPVNTDGGLKSFGHPVAATGIRMVYENYKQLQGKAELPERQLKNPKMALAMPQFGHPGWLGPIVCITGLPA
jgi:acetyl-CoA C-acetyltransferase